MSQTLAPVQPDEATGATHDLLVRERRAIATAQLNGCEHFLSAHTYIGEHLARASFDELVAARSAESSDAHIQSLLALSNDIAANSGVENDWPVVDLSGQRSHMAPSQ